MKRALTLLLSWLSIAVSPAITLFQIDDFTSGAQGWTNRAGTVVPADTGLASGQYLRSTSDGGGGAGSRHIYWNQSQWLGDFIGAGVTAINFEALSVGNDPIDFRFAFDGPGGWFVTEAIRIDDFAAGPDLTPFTLSLSEVDLTYAVGGTDDYAATMGNVTRMEILSANGIPTTGPNGILRGDQIDGELFVDNLQAIPEPAVGILAAMGVLALIARRRRS